MTGGTSEAETINLRLAEAAQECGVAMGVGSQRAAIEHPEQAKTFQVRRVAPDILLFANLGAVQFNYGYGVDQCRRAVEMIQADALYLHLNPLQEAVQDAGDTNWIGIAKRSKKFAKNLKCLSSQKKSAGASLKRPPKCSQIAACKPLTWQAQAARVGHKWKCTAPPMNSPAASPPPFVGWGIPTADSI
jgi:isopentenyl-diphosphate Delta-isomerase